MTGLPPRQRPGDAGPPWAAAALRARALLQHVMGKNRGPDEAGGDAGVTVAYAPSRVNLIGDHTDYQGGLAFPMALSMGAVAALRRRSDSWVGVVSEGKGGPVWMPVSRLLASRAAWDRRDANGPGGRTSPPDGDMDVPTWALFLAGALTEAGALEGLSPGCVSGLELALVSDVPVGKGLSSSAATGLASALAGRAAFAAGSGPEQGEWGRLSHRDRLDLCMAVQRAEHRYLSVPSGLLDELASAFGQAGHALWLDAATSTTRPVPFTPERDGAEVFLIDLGVERTLAASGYAARRREVEDAARQIGVSALGELSVADLPQALGRLSPVLGRRVRHVVTESERVRQTAAFARARRWSDVGLCMAESHRSLSEDYESSHPVLDRAVSVLRQGSPTVYARVTGGGFGGSLVALVVGAGRADVEARLRRGGFPVGSRAVEPVRAGPGLCLVDAGEA